MPNRAAPRPPILALVDALLAIGLLGLVFLLGCFRQIDTDIWWHLKAGRQILDGEGIPREDTYTFSAAGRTWIDLHWGFQAAAAWLYGRGGMPALTLGAATLGMIAVAIVLVPAFRTRTVSVQVACWLPTAFLLTGRFYVRPEMISLVCLACFLCVLHGLTDHPRRAWLLVPVQLLWVNVQGLCGFGPALAALWWGDQLVRWLFTRRRGWTRQTLFATLAIAAACLANPFTWRGALFPIELFRKMSVDHDFWGKHIGELRSVPTLIADYGVRNPYLVLHLALLVVTAASFLPHVVRWRLSWFRLFAFGAFGLLSLQATRNSGQFALVAGSVLAWNVAEFWQERGARGPRANHEAGAREDRSPGAAFGGRAALTALLAAAIWFVGSGRFYAFAGERRLVGLDEQPFWHAHDAARFVASPQMPQHVLAYHEGQSALIEFHMRPDQKVYVDPRLEVMPREVMEGYYELAEQIAGDRGDWRERLRRLPGPLAILADHEGHHGLQAALLSDPARRCVWFDAVAGVYIPTRLDDLVRDHGVDFGARLFQGPRVGVAGAEPAAPGPRPSTLVPRPSREPDADMVQAEAYFNVGRGVLERPLGDRRLGQSLLLLAMRHARAAASRHADRPDAWRTLGRTAFHLHPPLDPQLVRSPWSTPDMLGAARARHCLAAALRRAPDDFVSLSYTFSVAAASGDIETADQTATRLVARGARTPQQKALLPEIVKGADKLRSDRPPPPTADHGPARNLDELFVRADLWLARGDVRSAIRWLEGSAGRDGSPPVVGVSSKLPWGVADRLAGLYLLAGDVAAARRVWQSGAAGDVDDSRRAERIASTYLVEHDYARAVEHYQAALRGNPQLGDAQWGLAMCYLELGDADSLVRECEWALQNPTLTESLRKHFQWMRVLARPYAKRPHSLIPKTRPRP